MFSRGGTVFVCSLVPLLGHCGGSKASSSSPPAVVSVLPAAGVADSGTASTATKITGVLPGGVDAAAFMTNGHVLLSSSDAVFDWDPSRATPPRRVEVKGSGDGVADDSGKTIVFTQSGNHRFVVGRFGNQKKPRLGLELWDADTLTKIKSMEGTWVEPQPVHSFSQDGRRFLFMGCTSPRDEWSDCEVAVYALEGGSLVHRTTLPTLNTGPYMTAAQLSPTGTYFGVSNEFFPSEIRDSDSGKLVFRSPDTSEVYFSGMRFFFVDEGRAVTTARFGSKLRLTNLATARGQSAGAVDFKTDVSAHESASSHRLSSDRKRLALLIGRPRGSEVGVWKLDDNTSTTYSVPTHICNEYCEMHWVSSHEVIVHTVERDPKKQYRVDFETGSQATEPYAAAPPFESGGFKVFGDFDTSSWHDAAGVSPPWHGSSPNVADPTGLLVTPKGVKVDLEKLEYHDTALHVFGDRFLLKGRGVIKVVTSDGAVSELKSLE